MIGYAIIGECFIPSHYFKLPQSTQLRGTEAKPVAFLASIHACMSDKQKWEREEVVANVNNADIIPFDPRMGVSVS